MKSFPVKIFPDDFSNKRFWQKVAIKSPDECWLWLSTKKEGGYGLFGLMGLNRMAHRLVLFGVGERSEYLYALHKCDNPSCVNPKHLFAGTQKDNVRDCMDKGRFTRRGKLDSSTGKNDFTQ